MKKSFTLVILFVKMDLRNRAFIIPSFIFPILMITLMSIAGRSDGARGEISYASFFDAGHFRYGIRRSRISGTSRHVQLVQGERNTQTL